MSKLVEISIITVVFNDKLGLEKTICSVLSQSYKNIQHIIIDGGSGDGTLDIIKKYEDKIDYWVSERDSGIYDAMNKGIDLASGEWINFMNAGDIFFNQEVLNNLFNTKKFNNIELIFGNAMINQKKMLIPFNNINFYNNNKIKSFFCHQAIFFNQKKLNKENIKYDLTYKIKADRALITKLLYETGATYFINDMLICHYDNNGISNNKIIEKEFENIKISKKINLSSFIKTLQYSTVLIMIYFVVVKILKIDWNKFKSIIK